MESRSPRLLEETARSRVIRAHWATILNHPGHADQKSHGRKGSGGGDSVRDSLARAKDNAAIGAAASAEAKRITGRDIPFSFEGTPDPQLAREQAEGVLRGLERFPAAPLGAVRTYVDDDAFSRQFPDALAVTQGVGLVDNGKFTMQSTIYFNVGGRYATPDGFRDAKRESFEAGHTVGGTPMSTSLHEFGHVLTQGGGAVGHRAVYDRAVEHAESRGASPRYHITQNVSAYASTATGEFAAEIFADVMVNGDAASDLSHDAFSVIEGAYRK